MKKKSYTVAVTGFGVRSLSFCFLSVMFVDPVRGGKGGKEGFSAWRRSWILARQASLEGEVVYGVANQTPFSESSSQKT